jgi:hypothetical protein
MVRLRSSFYAHNPRSRTRHHARFPCHGPTATGSTAAAGPAARSGSAASRSGSSATRSGAAAACSDAKNRTYDSERRAGEEKANCSCTTPTKETCHTRLPRGHLHHRQWLARVSYPRPSGVLLHRSRLLLSLTQTAPRTTWACQPGRGVMLSTLRGSAVRGRTRMIATHEVPREPVLLVRVT